MKTLIGGTERSLAFSTEVLLNVQTQRWQLLSSEGHTASSPWKSEKSKKKVLRRRHTKWTRLLHENDLKMAPWVMRLAWKTVLGSLTKNVDVFMSICACMPTWKSVGATISTVASLQRVLFGTRSLSVVFSNVRFAVELCTSFRIGVTVCFGVNVCFGAIVDVQPAVQMAVHDLTR